MKLCGLLVSVWLVIATLSLPVLAQPDSQEAGAATGLQPISFKRDDTVSERTLVKVGVVTLFGVLLALAVLVALKKLLVKLPSAEGGENRIRLQVVKRLTPKLMLLIVHVDDKEYLIAQSGERVCITPHQVSASSQSSVVD